MNKSFKDIISFILTSIGGVGFLILFVPTYFSICNYYGSDAQVFTSVFYQLTQGKALYTEVFDHKDPIFHYLYSISFYLFEARGPMLLETIISISIVLLMILLLLKARLFWADRMSVLVIFLILFFSPRVYYPIHTYHLAIFFFLASLCFLEYNLYFLSGLLFSLSVLTRFPMATFFPVLLVSKTPVHNFFLRKNKMLALKPLFQIAFGAMFGTFFVVLVMILRSEFSGYIDVLRINFKYSKSFPLLVEEIIKFPPLSVHLQDIYSSIMVNFWLAISILNVVLLIFYFLHTVLRDRSPKLINLLKGKQFALSEGELHNVFFHFITISLLLSIGMAVILGNASYWNHYYQACGLVVAINLIPLLKIKKELINNRKRANIIFSLVLFFLLSGLVMLSGLTRDLKIQTLRNFSLNSCQAQLDPTMSHCLFGEPAVESMTYSTIAQPNYGIIAAYNPPNYSFECRLFYQFPFFGSLIDNFKSCLFETKPDLIIKAPYVYSIPALERSLNNLLNSTYLYAHNCGNFQVYIKKTN